MEPRSRLYFLGDDYLIVTEKGSCPQRVLTLCLLFCPRDSFSTPAEQDELRRWKLLQSLVEWRQQQ
jgi:hypothetical protein